MAKGVRDEVLAAFHAPCGYYHEAPHAQRNYIDGMFHVGILAGACNLHGDAELGQKARGHLIMLATYGVRAYGNEKLTDSWVEVASGIWGHSKPQSFAGPAALWWGAPDIARNCRVDDVRDLANLYVWLFRVAPWVFMHGPFDQHLNSVMLAHLLTGKRPWWYKDRLTERNPFYGYIYRERVEAKYPNISPWPAKNLPFWDGESVKPQLYTPTCQLASNYLQTHLQYLEDGGKYL
jgi:hypothetical protein